MLSLAEQLDELATIKANLNAIHDELLIALKKYRDCSGNERQRPLKLSGSIMNPYQNPILNLKNIKSFDFKEPCLVPVVAEQNDHHPVDASLTFTADGVCSELVQIFVTIHPMASLHGAI